MFRVLLFAVLTLSSLVTTKDTDMKTTISALPIIVNHETTETQEKKLKIDKSCSVEKVRIGSCLFEINQLLDKISRLSKAEKRNAAEINKLNQRNVDLKNKLEIVYDKLGSERLYVILVFGSIIFSLILTHLKPGSFLKR